MHLSVTTFNSISLFSRLQKLNKKNTLLYAINGLTLAVVFFSCRVLVYPYLYWRYAHYSNLSYLQVPFSIPFCCNFACFILMSLQLNWSYIILKGCLKYIYTTPAKEEDISMSNGDALSHSAMNGQANNFIRELTEDSKIKKD